MQPGSHMLIVQPPVFQSSPDPEAGCNMANAKTAIKRLKFQSSPDPEAGCNTTPVNGRCRLTVSFNPHPTRRPGATTTLPAHGPRNSRFQSSPDPEAGCNAVT